MTNARVVAPTLAVDPAVATPAAEAAAAGTDAGALDAWAADAPDAGDAAPPAGSAPRNSPQPDSKAARKTQAASVVGARTRLRGDLISSTGAWLHQARRA
ncbi:MAG TPA: hypothetical protein VH328_14340, partial [Burkholderiaceae bacterium]|nr:hypothetical protein [Burkholderiaceae bacterium]